MGIFSSTPDLYQLSKRSGSHTLLSLWAAFYRRRVWQERLAARFVGRCGACRTASEPPSAQRWSMLAGSLIRKRRSAARRLAFSISGAAKQPYLLPEGSLVQVLGPLSSPTCFKISQSSRPDAAVAGTYSVL